MRAGTSVSPRSSGAHPVLWSNYRGWRPGLHPGAPSGSWISPARKVTPPGKNLSAPGRSSSNRGLPDGSPVRTATADRLGHGLNSFRSPCRARQSKGTCRPRPPQGRPSSTTGLLVHTGPDTIRTGHRSSPGSLLPLVRGQGRGLVDLHGPGAPADGIDGRNVLVVSGSQFLKTASGDQHP